MGCFSSKNWELLIKTAKFQAWNEHFKTLSLSLSDLKKLHKIFSRVDFDNSGDISLAELLAHINLDRTRFTERIFSIFDDDKSGTYVLLVLIDGINSINSIDCINVIDGMRHYLCIHIFDIVHYIVHNEFEYSLIYITM